MPQISENVEATETWLTDAYNMANKTLVGWQPLLNSSQG